MFIFCIFKYNNKKSTPRTLEIDVGLNKIIFQFLNSILWIQTPLTPDIYTFIVYSITEAPSFRSKRMEMVCIFFVTFNSKNG